MSDKPHDLPYAHEMPYWRTGKSSPDAWIQKAKEVIAKLGGVVQSELFGMSNGRAAFMLQFAYEEERYRIVWPVLRVRTDSEETAARVQAATMLYHDVKSRMVAAQVLGVRTAFFYALQLPDGRTMAQVATPAITDALPKVALLGYDGAD